MYRKLVCRIGWSRSIGAAVTLASHSRTTRASIFQTKRSREGPRDGDGNYCGKEPRLERAFFPWSGRPPLHGSTRESKLKR